MAADQIPIGMFSRVTQLTQKALRLYDERGLLVPAIKDICSGYRYYTFAQIERAIRIRNLAWLGFSLHEIEDLMAARERADLERIKELFAARRAAVDAEIERLHAVRQVLQHQDLNLEVFSMTITEPVLKEVPPLRVVSRREKGVYGITIGKLIGELCAFFAPPNGRQTSVRAVGPVMTIYHDMEYKEEDADIEVAIPVAGRVAVEDPPLEVRNLPGGTFVSAVYTGPYPGIGRARQQIYGYILEHEYTLHGPSRELYLNDPALVPADQLMTEIQYPVLPS